MIRKIIHIDSERCNGCGLCAEACHEGAIGMLQGKAVLLRDDYCDGLGDCLPVCPTGAISFVEREASAYNEAEVLLHRQHQKHSPIPRGCPGTHAESFVRTTPPQADPALSSSLPASHLSNWPVQMKLVSPHAPYFQGADLLIAADCTAYAYAHFHQDFIKGRVTVLGCPKLDEEDYAVKLADILQARDIQSLTIVRMQVPCCKGLENAALRALQLSGKDTPWQVVTLSTDGRIVDVHTSSPRNGV